MPRQPRVYVEGYPHHVIQRGNNRQACFYDEADYAFYLECLQEACEKYYCSLHAYVLMTNHVHLLITPSDKKGIASLMQSVGRRYVKRVNSLYKRTGTLWEGRYKSSLVGGDAYVLACYRYIELNPVRAAMVIMPDEYRWSSYRNNIGVENSLELIQHPAFISLGSESKKRVFAYKKIFENSHDQEEYLTSRTLKELPIGNERFKEQIEQMLKIKFNRETIGRPKVKKRLWSYPNKVHTRLGTIAFFKFYR